jgi:hypothetical protein
LALRLWIRSRILGRWLRLGGLFVPLCRPGRKAFLLCPRFCHPYFAFDRHVDLPRCRLGKWFLALGIVSPLVLEQKHGGNSQAHQEQGPSHTTAHQ